MSFLDTSFLYFILIFFPAYYLISSIDVEKANIFVSLSSILFVAWYYPPFALIIFFQMAVIHYFYKESIRLPIAIIFLLLPLIIFKYSAFIFSIVGIDIKPLPLPLGISFYTFTAIAVLFEMSKSLEIRRKYSLNNSLKILAFWPHLASGPVLRPKNVWQGYVPFKNRDFVLAFILLIFGLFKKVVLADGAGAIVSRAIELGVANLSVVDIINMALAMSVQIYGDFSGYSDMALGFAILIGIKLPANFNFPYLADSLTEFWRRWHISLTSWFRDYVYITLGGSRKGKLKMYRNVLIVFVISGLWHGAAYNFIIWGALHGVVMVLEKATSFHLLPSIMKRIIVLPIIVLSWLIFFLSTDDLISLFDSELLTRENNPDAFGISVMFFIVLLIFEHVFRPYTVSDDGYPVKTLVGVVMAPLVLVACTLFWSEPLPFIYFDF